MEVKGGSAEVLYKCGWNQNKKVTSKGIKAQSGSKHDRINRPASVTTVCRQKGKTGNTIRPEFGSRPGIALFVKGLPLLSLRDIRVTCIWFPKPQPK